MITCLVWEPHFCVLQMIWFCLCLKAFTLTNINLNTLNGKRLSEKQRFDSLNLELLKTYLRIKPLTSNNSLTGHCSYLIYIFNDHVR